MLASAVTRRSLNQLWSRFALCQTNHLIRTPVATLSSRCLIAHSPSQGDLLTRCRNVTLTDGSIQKRFKKKKASKVDRREDSDDEDDDDGDLGEVDDDLTGLGYEDRVININANRFDVIFKAGSHSTRAAVDQAFFDNLFRVNGYCLTKKSEMASEGDVIDLIRGRNADNNNHLDVTRVEVLNVPDIGTNTGRLKMKIRHFKRLTIENYTEDPYEGSIIATVSPSQKED